ncbi:MAG: RNA polymerase subunit sigma-24 [Bacteroidetes bacterium]|nr:MAG: RNA polymerase subunit sigma-24 [Bacteroidota bacterium]
MPSSNSKNINQKTDLELIARYKQSNDLEVLGILYNRYIHLVYGVSLKYFKNPDESQDAAMQVFEKLIESLKKHDIQNFKSWLHVTTRNHCLMELRSRKTRGIRSDADLSLVSDMEFTTTAHHNNETSIENDLTLMKLCIEKLPEEQKRCIELFYLEQRSYKEVSLLAEFELKKVKSFIQNGKRNIKNCIEKNRE